MNRWLAYLAVLAVLAAFGACAEAVTEEGEDDDSGGGGSGGSGLGPGGTGNTGNINPGGNGGTPSPCGDGEIQAGETCDDGNHANDDSCPDDPTDGGTCEPATCGDGHVWSTDGGAEECDDGNNNLTDDCPDGATGVCAAATCTDGFLHSGGTGEEDDIDCGGSTCPGCPHGLILSEIVVAPTGSELIEIHNPTAAPIVLDQVYLADYAQYYLITQSMGPPGADDFRVTFPAGSSIPAGGRIVISTQSTAEFTAAFGSAPDYDFDSTDGGAPAMTGQIDTNAELGTTDEMLVLFRWNGVTDLVTDIDYLVWGNTSDAMDKSNVMVGAGTYQTEHAPGLQQAAPAPGSGIALGHCIYSEGTEQPSGGNGFAGADETTENLATTWRVLTPTPRAPNGCPVIAAVGPFSSDLTHLDSGTLVALDTVPITATGQTIDGALAMARHPQTGEVYAVIKNSLATRFLVKMNTANGVATIVAAMTDNVSSIAFIPSGTLYAVTGNGAAAFETLHTVNLTTAALTTVTALSSGFDGEVIALNPVNGFLYRFSLGGIFESINPVGPVITTIGHTGDDPGESTGAYWDPAAARFEVFNLGWQRLTVQTNGATVTTAEESLDTVRGPIIQ